MGRLNAFNFYSLIYCSTFRWRYTRSARDLGNSFFRRLSQSHPSPSVVWLEPYTCISSVAEKGCRGLFRHFPGACTTSPVIPSLNLMSAEAGWEAAALSFSSDVDLISQKYLNGLGDGSFVKLLALYTWGFEFGTPAYKNQSWQCTPVTLAQERQRRRILGTC